MAEATLDRGGTTRSSDAGSRRYGWLLGRELLVIATVFVAYRLVRALVKDEISAAFRNADRVIDWERAIGIFNEVRLQSGVLSNDALIWFLNRYYFFGHFVGAVVLLIWLYTRHFDRYGRVRRVMVLTTVSGLAMHVMFPLAPPRWFPGLGFVDTLQEFGPKVYENETVASTANQIAAMPSLHVAWALCIAWAVVIASSRRWRWVVIAHPVIMSMAVVLTANHWWLDVLAAAILVVFAIWADTPIQRWLERREAARAVASPDDDCAPADPDCVGPGPTHDDLLPVG